MTLEEQVKARYPRLGAAGVQGKLRMYAQIDNYPIEYRMKYRPRFEQAPEYLKATGISRVLRDLTYLDIATYAWDLHDQEGIEQVLQVAQRWGIPLSMVRPPYHQDIISPAVFHGVMWDAFKDAGITKYSELVNRQIDLFVRYYTVNKLCREVLKSKGLAVTVRSYTFIFTPCEEHDYLADYERQGFVAFSNYKRRVAEEVERTVQTKYPNAKLQFDRECGVVLR